MALTRTILASLSVAYFIVAFGVVLATPKANDVSNQIPSRLSGYVQLNKISSPALGVKLLEDILEKVRRVPQIAMAKGLRQQAQASLPRKGPTDYHLAIKPKDVSLAQQATTPAPSGFPTNKSYDGYSEKLSLRKGGIWEAGQQLAATESGRKTVWESDTRKLDKDMPLSEESQERLSNAIGKLYGLTKQLEASDSLVSQSPSPARRARTEARSVAGYAASSGGAGLVGSYGVASEATSKSELKAKGIEEYVLSEPVPLARTTPATQVALLPPNVVTGIPLVRLGSSETQANQALAAIGNMSSERINAWTVWSYCRPNSKHTALQVYMRHGLVEALRIFDGSFAHPDLGVNLGDDLSAIKGRFGEPAFILGEPSPGLGQNYVYPISQVAFLMARPRPDAHPEVISLLIFNIK
ncbi:MAG: hypothetical protein HY711_11160 [Candidatus Melainabacteria bacterium]|nr:hypothetical protein [Candidatus Melainabacteria bacterium]